VAALWSGLREARIPRCHDGRVLAAADEALPSSDDLTPVKARVELLLQLL
jgi:hypothetical protein